MTVVVTGHIRKDKRNKDMKWYQKKNNISTRAESCIAAYSTSLGGFLYKFDGQ